METEEGSPQGGNLSPLLANVYLNEFDQEFTKRGVPEYYAQMAANTRKGHWFCANLTTVKRAMTKERRINSGFYDLATAYQSVHVNY